MQKMSKQILDPFQTFQKGNSYISFSFPKGGRDILKKSR